MSDPYFNNVSLLVQGSGNHGDQTFSDSSNNNHAVTFYGQTKISNTQQLFGQNTIEFDGSGDTIMFASEFGSWQLNIYDSFTMECWLFLPTGNARMNYLLNCVTAGSDYQFIFRVNGTTGITPYNKLSFLIYQLEASPFTRDTINSDADVTRNAWHHVSISYDGTNFYLGLDGTIKTQARTISSIPKTTSPLYIGAVDQTDTTTSIQGFMQDIRITKGVARYIANYTPPTALFSTSGPNLTDAFFNNNLLLIRGSGLHGSTTFTDLSNQGHLIAPYGQTMMSNSKSLFRQNVIELDGSQDVLKIPTSSSWQLNVGQPFTIECWFYPQKFNDYLIYCEEDVNNGYVLYVDSSRVYFYIYQENPGYQENYISTTGTVTLNAWHHTHISYDGTNFYIGLDGIVDSKARTLSAFKTLTNPIFYIGASSENATSYVLDGFIQDIRFTKGLARYTRNYTVPNYFHPSSGPVQTIPNFRVLPIKQNYSHFYRHL